MKTVVISQPMYFPWPGFMAQMALADVYVWLDDAQFSKGSFINRVQVRTESGRAWMTIPLSGSGSYRTIADLAAVNDKWRDGHRDLLRQQFKRLPHEGEALDIFERAARHDRLVDTLIASCEEPAKYLDIMPRQITRSSELGVSGKSWQRVLDIVLACSGTRYLTGHGAMEYLDFREFERAGVAVEFMDYAPLSWAGHREPFIPYVTILEPIAHEGLDAVRCLNPRTVDWRSFIDRNQEAGS